MQSVQEMLFEKEEFNSMQICNIYREEKKE